MLYEELGSLETFRELLPDRLLDDTRSGKSDECPRLRKDDISEHRETCRHAARRRISQNTHIELSGLMMSL